MGLFGLTIGWDAARAMVLPLDILYSGGDDNHNIEGPFHHFGNFFYLGQLCDRQGLVPKHFVNQQFYSR
jgi:hypothetical protein